ncbi:MAG: hypothetical protein LBF36_01210 [Mycoplasmataceae bacterium]|jgi:hypothetical protein|nr:hypothetical protein [Mycoplasmataceae bacterium]
MQVVTQNRIGSITLTEGIIRFSVLNYARFNTSYKLIDLEIHQNEINRFFFVLTFATNKYTKMIDDINAIISYIQKQIEKNLQLFGSTLIVKISN